MLTACSSAYDAEDVAYADDYGSHAPLNVVGYPSTGSFGITQQVVWRIADGEVGELASLVAGKGDTGVPEKTAENWIAAFGKGARATAVHPWVPKKPGELGSKTVR